MPENQHPLIILGGEFRDFEVSANLMDSKIREAIHMDLAPCTEQEFIDEYCLRHEAKYGEEFIVS